MKLFVLSLRLSHHARDAVSFTTVLPLIGSSVPAFHDIVLVEDGPVEQAFGTWFGHPALLSLSLGLCNNRGLPFLSAVLSLLGRRRIDCQLQIAYEFMTGREVGASLAVCYAMATRV